MPPQVDFAERGAPEDEPATAAPSYSSAASVFDDAGLAGY